MKEMADEKGKENICGTEQGKEEVDSKIVHKPNLLRVAAELATRDEPYKIADSLLALLERCTKNPGDRDQDVGLLLGDILSFIN